MKVWEALVGAREDLPNLRHKWWHQLAIVFWGATAFVMFFVAAAYFSRGAIVASGQNTFSLPLVTFSQGRPGEVTRLSDLYGIPGEVALLRKGEDAFAPLQRPEPPEDIQCESPAKYSVRQSFVVKDAKTGADVRFTAIPNFTGQPDAELRACAASPAYAGLDATTIVSYRLDSYYRRWRSGRTAARALAVSVLWFILCLNVYYRGFISIYEVRRRKRIRPRGQTIQSR